MSFSKNALVLLFLCLGLLGCDPRNQENPSDSDNAGVLVIYVIHPNALTRIPITPDRIRQQYDLKVELRSGLGTKFRLLSKPMPSDIRILVDRLDPQGRGTETFGFAGLEDFGAANWKLLEPLIE